eukprot:scaffold169319_cov15-Tisochrysis_lutea.AAC.1
MSLKPHSSSPTSVRSCSGAQAIFLMLQMQLMICYQNIENACNLAPILLAVQEERVQQQRVLCPWVM